MTLPATLTTPLAPVTPATSGAPIRQGVDAAMVQRLADALLRKSWMLATAESCTGGLIAATCTDLAGSSAWFERGLVTYSNAAKVGALGVDPAVIAEYGAVSEAVARAMASGALARSDAQVAVAVTGVAGPGGGSDDKPVGMVWFGFALGGLKPSVSTEVMHFAGDRAAVRWATVQHALARLIDLLDRLDRLDDRKV